MQLVRYRSTAGAVVFGIAIDDKHFNYFPTDDVALYDLLRLNASEFRHYIDETTRAKIVTQMLVDATNILAPIDGDAEVWAAEVTYQHSGEARQEQGAVPDIYTRVSTAERPGLFFKATPRRVSGQNAPLAIRSDSDWNVPEPELVVVVNIYGEIVGYAIGNDMSSRSLPAENPLYLSQAKIYTGSCALGPGITPAWEIADPYNLIVHMLIERDGQRVWEGQASTNGLLRKLPDLVSYLFRDNSFPDGAFLFTGTALIPDPPFTLQAGDVVQITIDQLGTLRNPVMLGKEGLAAYRAS